MKVVNSNNANGTFIENRMMPCRTFAAVALTVTGTHSFTTFASFGLMSRSAWPSVFIGVEGRVRGAFCDGGRPTSARRRL